MVKSMEKVCTALTTELDMKAVTSMATVKAMEPFSMGTAPLLIKER